MKTHCDRLLSYLQTHGTIDPMRAWSELGIYRLSARVMDLRKKGYQIVKTTKAVKNRFNEDCRVAEYKLENAL